MPRSMSRRFSCVSLTLMVGALLLLAPPSAGAKDTELAPKHISLTADQAPADRGDNGAAKTKRPTASNGIDYHGGPVILGTTNAYVIWYGNWASSPTQALVSDFLSSVGGSAYYNINTTYYDGAGRHVSNSVALAGSTTDNYSQGKVLSDAGVKAVVSSAVSSGLPRDTNGVYFVLTSSDVSESSGFLTQYCGWHTHGSIAGADLQYSFVGDASAKLSACAVQTTSSPNNNPAGDAMISVIAHELEESATDPDLNAWYDNRGYENADKCAWTFGTTYSVANGSKANMQLGSRDYLIQRNWVNASGGYCGLKI